MEVKFKARRQPTERLKRLDNSKTEFARWRAIVGLLQEEAAGVLGISKSAVQSYERGDSAPVLGTRILMRIIADKGEIPKAWPE